MFSFVRATNCILEWRWMPGHEDAVYRKVLQQFLDRKDSCYSIHQIGDDELFSYIAIASKLLLRVLYGDKLRYLLCLPN